METLSKYHPDNKQITLTNPFNGRKTIVEIWADPIGQFTVRAGANSDYSYTGFIPNIDSIESCTYKVFAKHYNKEIFK